MEEVETLSATLHQHAVAVRERHAAIERLIEDERAAEEASQAESTVLQAEIAQYRGWISEEIEGGGAYRLNKALADERERRSALENEVAMLKQRLSGASAQLKSLVHQATTTPQVQQARAAEEALQHLSKMRQLGAQPRFQ